jgi:hypothetical protein
MRRWESGGGSEGRAVIVLADGDGCTTVFFHTTERIAGGRAYGWRFPTFVDAVEHKPK